MSLLRPAARAAITLENEPGILRSAARRRSGGRSVRGLASARLRQRAQPGSGGSGFRRGLGLASDRRIISEASSATAAQNDRPTLRRADDFEPTPPRDRSDSRQSGVRRVLSRSRLPHSSASAYRIVAAAEGPLNVAGDERSVALTLSRSGKVRTRSRLISVPPCRLSHFRVRCSRSIRGSGPCATSVSTSP